ncbi:MAG TPA: DUF6603 domain-containing protein [Solirubrobacteraceae bacterium]|nr:DUF6603 domain-containing protein [Solirubrobacteraceae bacterium]
MSGVPATNALNVVASEIVVMLDPLRRVVDDSAPPHELIRLLRSAGWALPGLGSVDLDTLNGDLQALFDAVDELPDAVRSRSLPEVAEALVATADALAAVRDLRSAFDGLFALLDLEAPAGAAAALAQDLGQALMLAWLARRRPRALAAMRALGIVRNAALPAVTGGSAVLRSGAPRPRLDLAAVPSLLGDPIGTLQAAVGYSGLGDSRDAQALALVLGARARRLVGALGGRLDVWPPWGWLQELPEAERDAAGRTLTASLALPSPGGVPILPELSLAMEVLSPHDEGQLGRRGPGVELRPAGLAPLTATRGPWTLDLAVASTVDAIFAGPDTITGAGGGTLSANAALSYAPPNTVILGADGGTRLELGVPSIGLGIDLVDEPDLSVELALTGVAIVVAAGDGDSFVAGALPDVELNAGFDLGVAWSRRAGLRLSGANAGLDFRVPIERAIGTVATLHWVDAALEIGETLDLSLGAAATVALGPFAARVEGVGLRVAVGFPPDNDGNLGPADLALAFKPPSGVAFELDLGDVGQGGGFVDYDPELGRYTGALELELLEVGLGAIVVIDTRLPDDPDGWALFASIFATFPSLPLGFGFFLSGVGGLVCLNRTMDADALASGLKSGAIDAILFPDDPLEDAALILSQLDAWFPLAEGSSVFGVAARITWGTPVPIVTGQLGVAIVLPDLEIAVLGSIAMLLPSEEEVLLELHMDSLGVIDVPGQTVTVLASLYDSALLSTIHLSGDMAFYVSFGASPAFLLSIGGYHPDFDPPCGLPPSVLALDRMRAEVAISDDVFFSLEAYVAVTSNTLQFGSLATLEASAKFLLTTYTARGSVGFDVLLVFSPFSFAAAFQLSVSVSAGDNELLAVELSAQLDGPSPWYTSGYARFDFFGIDVRFDFEFGADARPETPERQDVCGLVVTALDAPAAWRAAEPAWADTTVLVFAPDDDADPSELWIRPDADLETRQSVAPLDRDLDHFGEFAIDGPTTLAVTGAGIEGATEGDDWAAIADWFAPAQYDDLTRAEKLAAPSYEEMTTGVRFGAAGLGIDADEATTVTPDFEVRIIDEAETRRLGVRPAGALAAATVALVLDPARPRPARSVTGPTFAVGAPTWQVFDPDMGAAASPVMTYRDAQRALADVRRSDPGAGLCLAPTHAAEAVA